jgi:hypothetical protein
MGGKGEEEIENGWWSSRPHSLYISIGEGLLVRPPLA